MARKYAAIRTTFYTVYRYSTILGSNTRWPVISYPERADAERYASQLRATGAIANVEEMAATIKSWDGCLPA